MKLSEKEKVYKKLYNAKLNELDKQLNDFLIFKKLYAKETNSQEFEK